MTYGTRRFNFAFIRLTAPKGGTPVNWTSATDWQMEARRDNVFSITFRQV